MRTALQQDIVPALEPVMQGHDVASLVSALAGETRLLDDLAGTLRQQRLGVATDNVELVDESVYGAWRIMRTMEEARRRRLTLTERVFGDPIAPRDWNDTEGIDLPLPLRAPCERLLSSADVVAREIEINRRVLDRAIRNGEHTVRTLFGAAPVAAPCYAATTAAPAAAAGPALINRQV